MFRKLSSSKECTRIDVFNYGEEESPFFAATKVLKMLNKALLAQVRGYPETRSLRDEIVSENNVSLSWRISDRTVVGKPQ